MTTTASRHKLSRRVPTTQTHIKREECTVSTTLAQLRRGCAPSKRRAKYDAVDRRLKQAHDEYVRGDIDAQLLLRRIRHVMHVFH